MYKLINVSKDPATRKAIHYEIVKAMKHFFGGKTFISSKALFSKMVDHKEQYPEWYKANNDQTRVLRISQAMVNMGLKYHATNTKSGPVFIVDWEDLGNFIQYLDNLKLPSEKTEKTCRNCHQVLPIDQFRCIRHLEGGRDVLCKKCRTHLEREKRRVGPTQADTPLAQIRKIRGALKPHEQGKVQSL